MNRKDAGTARRLGAPPRTIAADAIGAALGSGRGEWIAADAALEALERAGYTVTARASRATTGPPSPTGGHGAAPDPAEGGEGRTEASVTVNRSDLAEVILYADGVLTTAPQEAVDRLNAAVAAAVQADHLARGDA